MRLITDEMLVSPNKNWTAEELMDPANLAIAAKHQQKLWNHKCMPQVRALMQAGWQFEVVHECAADPWQWAWRRPPRRAGSKGMRFASTEQAYNALMRASRDPLEEP